MIIGPSQYSKDAGIKPEAIVVTLPVQFFENRNTNISEFTKLFERFMAKEDSLWNFRLTNLPTMDVGWVYMVWDKQVQFRLNFVQYERNVSKQFMDAPDGQTRKFPNANWIIMCGPAVKPPHEWPQKGFQGFRYATKLF